MNSYKIKNKDNQRQSIIDKYGSRRGIIISHFHQLLYLTGRFKRFKDINWKKVKRLVFVCSGNICRSPYAEALANRLGVETISCGIDTVDGKPANERAIEVASDKGIDLSVHKARKLSSISIKSGDLYIAMDYNQAKYLEMLFGEGYQITLLGLWGKPVNPYINDPYGKSYAYFSNCFDFMEGSLENIMCELPERLIGYSDKVSR